MTDTMFTHTALTEVAENAGVTPDQARTILEAAGVKVQPEKPAPGLYLHEDGRPIIMIGPNFTEPDSYLTVVDDSHWTRGNRDKLTPARLIPVEGEPIADAAKLIASAAKPIDLADVLEGDRVRLELENGDEATITVTRVAPDFLTSERYVFYTHEIRAVHLLHREEA